ncbi:MAG TPA: hypothetical protein VGQ32_03465 [Thermoanaerobaculia bacterium]|nr:hypothetical protein [Thermoanaerobaculia bacterium]
MLALVSAPALAQLTTGDVLAGVGAGKIKRFNPAGVLQQTLDSGTTSSETTGMCFDASANLFGTLFSISQVAKYNSAGTLLTNTFGSGFQSAESCVVDAAGNLYFGQGNGSTIRKFDPAGALITSYSPTTGPRGTDWIDLAADQCTMHYTSEGSAIKTFNVCTNTQGPDFATNLTGGSCYAHRIRPNGEELVACTTLIHRVSSAGAILQTYTATAFTPPETFVFALNLDPDGTTFWTGGISSGRVYRVNIATGAQVTEFNAGILGGSMAGLAVVGEIVVSQPTPTPGGPTPTPTGIVVINPLASNPVPTLNGPAMAVLGLLLASLGIFLMKRSR